MAQGRSEVLYAALRLVAPGTPLREGIDRILQAKMGALIVVGDGPAVLNICSGGFLLDAEFTPQRLSELAKMDGAIILASDGTRVARANVHLVPDPDIPTNETGTRHRTAERVARQISVPVITVSEEMGVVSVHYQGNKQTLDRIPRVLARADQALQILGRYKSRLDGVTGALSALEVEDLVTVRDVVTVLQRAEMVRRIAEEIEGYVVELGLDGRLVELQLEELTGGVLADLRLVGKDYFVESPEWMLAQVTTRLAHISDDELLDLRVVAVGAAPAARARSRLVAAAARLPLAQQDPAPARDDRRPRHRALRHAAQGDAREPLRSRRGRRRRRGTGPRDQGRTLPRRGDVDPRSLRVICRLAAGRIPARFARLRELASLTASSQFVLLRIVPELRDVRVMAALREGPVHDVTVEAQPARRRRTRGAGSPRPARRHADGRASSCIPTSAACARCSRTWRAGSPRTASRSARSNRSPASRPTVRGVGRGAPRRTSRISTTPSRWTSSAPPPNLLVVDDDVATVSVLGFCMGGHYTFKAASIDRFDAAVAFYGMVRTPEAWRGPGHRIEPLSGRGADGADAGVLRFERSVHAGGRHRRVAGRVERAAPTARSSSSKAPSTASSTTPTATSTAPTTRPPGQRSWVGAVSAGSRSWDLRRAESACERSELAGVRLVSQSRAQRAAQTSDATN